MTRKRKWLVSINHAGQQYKFYVWARGEGSQARRLGVMRLCREIGYTTSFNNASLMLLKLSEHDGIKATLVLEGGDTT